MKRVWSLLLLLRQELRRVRELLQVQLKRVQPRERELLLRQLS